MNNKNINGGGLPIDMGDGPGTFNEVTISDHVPGSPAQVDAVRCNFYYLQGSSPGLYLNKVNTGATSVIVGHDEVQDFSFKINMLNDGETVSEGWFATDTLPAEFNVTKVRLHREDGVGINDSSGETSVNLDDDHFFGLKLDDDSCEVSIRRPDSHYKLMELGKTPPKLQPEFIVLRQSAELDPGEFCTLEVTVETDVNPAGKPEPTSCDWFVDSEAVLLDYPSEIFFDRIKLNEGVRLFNAAGELQWGPKHPIWLDPIGCVGPKDDDPTDGIPDILDPYWP